MAIVRWDPFREMANMQERFNGLFNEDYGRTGEDWMSRGTWLPPVDIYSNGNHEVVIKAELPDMKREDIELTVENNTLTLRGEKKIEPEVKQQQFHRVERSYGAFSRSFTLPNTIDTGHVHAEYKDGVLTVKLPFREEAKPRQIPVGTAA